MRWFSKNNKLKNWVIELINVSQLIIVRPKYAMESSDSSYADDGEWQTQKKHQRQKGVSVKYATSNDSKKGLAKINNKGLHKPIENVHKVKGNQLLIGTAMDENAFFCC